MTHLKIESLKQSGAWYVFRWNTALRYPMIPNVFYVFVTFPVQFYVFYLLLTVLTKFHSTLSYLMKPCSDFVIRTTIFVKLFWTTLIQMRWMCWIWMNWSSIMQTCFRYYNEDELVPPWRIWTGSQWYCETSAMVLRYSSCGLDRPDPLWKVAHRGCHLVSQWSPQCQCCLLLVVQTVPLVHHSSSHPL